MLYITDSKHANNNNINGDRLTIDFNFLKERNGVYVDRQKLKQKDEFGNTQYKDYRPMWLIDGQHRIKGIHQNTEESQNLTLPIVIFPKEFGQVIQQKFLLRLTHFKNHFQIYMNYL